MKMKCEKFKKFENDQNEEANMISIIHQRFEEEKKTGITGL